MDSTMVVQMTKLAGQIGQNATTVLVWWLVLKIGINVLWAAVVVFGLWRLSALLGTIGKGQQLLQIVGGGSAYAVNDSGFAKAQSALLAAFPKGRN